MNNIESLKAYFSSELILFFGAIIVLLLAMRRGSRDSLAAGMVSLFTLVFSLFALVSTHFESSLSLFME